MYDIKHTPKPSGQADNQGAEASFELQCNNNVKQEAALIVGDSAKCPAGEGREADMTSPGGGGWGGVKGRHLTTRLKVT